MTQPPDDASQLKPIAAKLAAPMPADPAIAPEVNATTESESNQSGGMMQGRAATLGILFLVTGALGIPLLWVSPHFSNRERWFWAIIVSLYTLILLVVAGGAVWWVYKRMLESGLFG